MSGLISGYEHDIFISYRQKDNKYDGWVTEFIDSLKKELEATSKEDINIYFDINPSDYLLESYDVDASLRAKLKCLVFIPIISRTYCDPKSFAWEHEFKPFIEQASRDQFGLKVKLSNGNVASRILPVQIHEIDSDDKAEIEKELGGILRPIEFIYKEPGVNRPIRINEDYPDNNLNKTSYRNQINKVANAVDEIISSLKKNQTKQLIDNIREPENTEATGKGTGKEKRIDRAKSGRLRKLSGIAVLSFLIIAATLSYLKISEKRNSLDDVTYRVSVINENGKKEVRRIFKDGYISKLAVYPFMNLTNDSSKNWLQYAFRDGICQDLNQFEYVTLWENDQAIHLQEQIKDAATLKFPYFLTGEYRITDGIFEVNSKLYHSGNGKIIAEKIFRGDNLFSIIDSISLQTRISLGISKSILNSSPDLPFMQLSTDNTDAYRYYIKGSYMDSLAFNLNKSIELDSTFALALYYRAYDNFLYQFSHESAVRDIDQAMRHRQKLPEYFNVLILSLYYAIHVKDDKSIALLEMQHELKPGDASLLDILSITYLRNFRINELQKATHQLTKLSPNDPYRLYDLAYSYLITGEEDKGLKIMDQSLKLSPGDIDAVILTGDLYLHRRDTEAAEEMYNKAILSQPENEKNWSRMFDHIAYSKENQITTESLKSFIGDYRFEIGEMTVSFFIHNDHLIAKAKNQYPVFNYPVSDTCFISINGSASFTFTKKKTGEIIGTTLNQHNRSSIAWKEDSVILEAMRLLDENKKSEALTKFREASAHHPDHYYLQDFIRHLEFILSEEYESNKAFLESCTGKYGNLRIFKKNDLLYFEDYRGYIFKLLPTAEDQFISPSFYNRHYEIIRKNDSILGLRVVTRDGKENFFSRDQESFPGIITKKS